ncbi:MAG: hypothetical protein HRU09_19965 [Oligoflexales bacterium]|nr:hypothetical protein [Oligoflexales bacterium]
MTILLKYLGIFLVFACCDKAFAEKTKPTFSIRTDLRVTKLRFPSSLDFGQRKIDRSANVFVAGPFSFKDSLVLDERFVSAVYMQVYVIHLTSFVPFDPKFQYDEAKAKELQMTLLESRSKDRGDKGLMYQFKQFIGERVVYKWISVFGNKHQTDVIIALYPDQFASTFIPPLLEGLVETAYITKESL